jgi:hypothetical protein
MPAPIYNPHVLGFSAQIGPLSLPLSTAREQYGRLPSELGLLEGEQTDHQHRRDFRTLNVHTGHTIRGLLGTLPGNQPAPPRVFSLKRTVWQFYQHWHRNYEAEFGIRNRVLFNRNDGGLVWDVLQVNRNVITHLSNLDLLTEGANFVRKDVLNSVKASFPQPSDQPQRLRKLKEILQRKIATLTKEKRATAKLNRLQAQTHFQLELPHLQAQLEKPLHDCTVEDCQIFADEIAEFLGKCLPELGLVGLESLKFIRPHGIQFRYTPRTKEYLELGADTQDCTAPKRPIQYERDVENIYWTTFAWLLDFNYQVLEVWYDGEFVMKAHLLPLFFYQAGDYQFFLGIDAIETVTEYRDWERLSPAKQSLALALLQALVAEVGVLADQMGIQRIYAEKFSNTDWIRREFSEGYPEIFLAVNQIHKMDDLEDVFECACSLSKRYGYELPQSIFMEIQMKNTALFAESVYRDSKAFALLKGAKDDGVSLRSVAKV